MAPPTPSPPRRSPRRGGRGGGSNSGGEGQQMTNGGEGGGGVGSSKRQAAVSVLEAAIPSAADHDRPAAAAGGHRSAAPAAPPTRQQAARGAKNGGSGSGGTTRSTRSRAAKGREEQGGGTPDDGDAAYDEPDASPPIKIYTGTKKRRTKKQKTSAAGANTSSGKGGAGGGKAGGNSNTKLSRNRDATERLLSRTRYEIEVDPYRGIYDRRHGFEAPVALAPIDTSAASSATAATSSTGPAAGGTASAGQDVDDDVLLVEEASRPPPPPANPWGGCGGCCSPATNTSAGSAGMDGQIVTLTPLFDADGNGNLNGFDLGSVLAQVVAASNEDTTSSNANANANANANVPLVPRCLCESRNKWADDAADVERKRVKKARDKKAAQAKGRKGRGHKRQRSNSVAVAAEDDSDAVVVVDGGEPSAAAKGGGEAAPNSDEEPTGGATAATEAAAAEAESSSDAKIHVSVMPIRRSADPSYRCPCDYNPLCLSSLGGSIDDLIHRKALERARQELRADGIDPSGSNVVVVDDFRSIVGGAGGKAGAKTDIDDVMRLRKSLPVRVDSIRKHLTEVVRPFVDDGGGGGTGGAACSEEESMANHSVDECVNIIQEMHKRLIYEDDGSGVAATAASSMDKESDSNSIQLSTPPGLRNLGATCYLNSQFQCLAQNPAFVDGVFSWIGREGSSGGSRMDQVLLTMQTLLAQMNHGAQNVVCTEPFGNALGLEHDEMQDPNEFARLLFDRMHESFQKSALAAASSSSYAGGGANACSASALAELLPNLFRGVCTYETKCCKCDTKSMRSENFMELTLPLVKPGDLRIKETSIARAMKQPVQDNNKATGVKSKSNKKKGRPKKSTNGKGSENDDTDGGEENIASALNQQDSRDVTVQGCLDAYLHAEMLEDENQFHCNNCAMKCDAIRSVSLSELPPVLNILLARYVFDRLTFMKKKLSDRVLLPRTLMVPRKRHVRNGGEDVEEVDNVVYVLCAIQNHRGASAYGGHYVAEAMDWTTGVWYDYNDEEVTLLPNGPSCSYVPVSSQDDRSMPSPPPEAASASAVSSDGRGKGKIKRALPLRGSSDAYSLFYVERSFLAKTASRHILRNIHILDASSENCISEANTIAKMTQQRKETYQLMNEMSLERKLTGDRLQQRKREIEQRLFDALCNNDRASETASSTPVWVDASTLLRFLSCLDGMEKTVKNCPMLQHRQLICNHGSGGLHPRVAKGGKLLPRNVYNTFAALLRDEGNQFCPENESGETPKRANGKDDVSDCVISTDSNLFCQECAEAYRGELAKKERSLSLILKLYDALDSKINDFEPKSPPEGQEFHAISRHFITTFKKHVERVMKEATSPKVVCEGIDLLDLSFLPGFSSDEPSSALPKATEETTEATASVGEPLDPTVNGKITCSHGRSNVLTHKRSVRLVPASVWNILKQLFPQAIYHRRLRRRLDNGQIEDLSNNEPFEGKCLECELDKAGNSQMLQKLQAWGHRCISVNSESPSHPSLHRLYSWDASSGGDSVRHIQGDSEHSFRLVHHDNIQTWRSAIDITQTLLPNKKKNKGASDEAKERLLSSTLWNFKSILCVGHGRTTISHPVIERMVSEAMTGKSCCPDEKDSVAVDCMRQVELLTEGEYQGFIQSLQQLRDIILPYDEANPLLPEECNKYHPIIALKLSGQGEAQSQPSVPSVPTSSAFAGLTAQKTVQTQPSAPSVFSAPADATAQKTISSAFLVYSNPPFCEDPLCLDGFVAAAIALRPSPDGKAGPQDVQIVESKDDGLVDIKVHELEGHVEMDAALACLLPEFNASTGAGDSENGERATRRSTRKRKTRTEGITTHDFRLYPHDNLAKLKLLLLERANKKLFNQEWRLVSLKAGGSPPVGEDQEDNADASLLLSTTELGNDEKALCDYVGDAKASDGDNAAAEAEGQCLQEKTLHLILRYRDDGGGNGRKSKRLTTEEKEERRKAEDSLMAALTDIANVPDSSYQADGAATEQGAKSRSRRRRREERGFRGTFLHGMSSPSNAEDGTFTPKELSPSASPNAPTTECIILDASPAKDNQPMETQSTSAVAADDTLAKQQPTPPLQDMSDDVIVIDDDEEYSSPRNDEPMTEHQESHAPASTSPGKRPPPEGQASGATTTQAVGKDLTQPPESDRRIFKNSAVEADPDYNPKSIYDLGRNSRFFTAPIYTPSAPPIADEDGTHLCCGLASLSREAAVNFIDSMSKKPDAFWENVNIEFEAIKAFQYLLPKSVPHAHARQLYRNFSDSPDDFDLTCTCKEGKPLPISRREMDIMLYFIYKGQTSRECHRFMPYRNERDLRHVFDTVKKCFRDGAVSELYMRNVIVAVERIMAFETNAEDV